MDPVGFDDGPAEVGMERGGDAAAEAERGAAYILHGSVAGELLRAAAERLGVGRVPFEHRTDAIAQRRRDS